MVDDEKFCNLYEKNRNKGGTHMKKFIKLIIKIIFIVLSFVAFQFSFLNMELAIEKRKYRNDFIM